MILIKEKDFKLLGIRVIDLDSNGNIVSITGMHHRIDKIYNWAILDIDYAGG